MFGVFLTLEATEIILFIGFFASNPSIIKVGGYVGVLTAVVAWYASAALVSIGIGGPLRMPVGRPLIARVSRDPGRPHRGGSGALSSWRGTQAGVPRNFLSRCDSSLCLRPVSHRSHV